MKPKKIEWKENPDYIMEIFNMQLDEIQQIIDYHSKLKNRMELYQILPLIISDPFYECIRYRYIVAVEFFKAISKYINETYDFYDYKKMNKNIMGNDKDIKKLLGLRNLFAHINSLYFLEFDELDIKEIKDNLEKLKIILKYYVEFIRKTKIPNNIFSSKKGT